MIETMPFSITTERLYLREMNLGDLDFIAEMLSHPEVMEYYPKLYSRGEAKDWIDRQIRRYEEDGHGLWLVEDRATSSSIGQVGLCLQQIKGRALPEIGYLIHRSFWRKGFAIEAAIAVREYSFRELGHQEVFSLIKPANKPSQAVARRLGMRVEQTVLFHGVLHLLYRVSAAGLAGGTQGACNSG
jgi:RimJ/RimL family protein N-acetyltransferase